ncbi:hypothetical protein ALC62_12545 [Cyphomyrmex costatus]|uniref:Uncharacterized protein n=1 Tax=Cyphomyrmex costatus TaxID=456900 RepID=A0A195C9G2_9HYME|nr:hypothetical protein ALC62_12545 [Cyphomyrmex costatus]
MIDSRGYVIEPPSCVRKQREPGDKATDNHGRLIEYFPRPSRRNKTMTDKTAPSSREGTGEIREIQGGEGSGCGEATNDQAVLGSAPPTSGQSVKKQKSNEKKKTKERRTSNTSGTRGASDARKATGTCVGEVSPDEYKGS